MHLLLVVLAKSLFSISPLFSPIHRMLHEIGGSEYTSKKEVAQNIFLGRPNADLYPDTTVLFADVRVVVLPPDMAIFRSSRVDCFTFADCWFYLVVKHGEFWQEWLRRSTKRPLTQSLTFCLLCRENQRRFSYCSNLFTTNLTSLLSKKESSRSR